VKAGLEDRIANGQSASEGRGNEYIAVSVSVSEGKRIRGREDELYTRLPGRFSCRLARRLARRLGRWLGDWECRLGSSDLGLGLRATCREQKQHKVGIPKRHYMEV
jgi:hypothetical protein